VRELQGCDWRIFLVRSHTMIESSPGVGDFVTSGSPDLDTVQPHSSPESAHEGHPAPGPETHPPVSGPGAGGDLP
jgi:hypothetical protein